MVTRTDEAGVINRYSYDSMGRHKKASDNIGNIMTYEYDSSGNLIKQTDTIGGKLSMSMTSSHLGTGDRYDQTRHLYL